MFSTIVGKRFNCINRAVDMLCLFLGEDYSFAGNHGKGIEVAEYSFHFQTQWRFVVDGEILLAARDIYEPFCENVTGDWQYDVFNQKDEERSLFDVLLSDFNRKMSCASVTAVSLSSVNDLKITFSNGVVFEQFMLSSRKDEEWRLIDYVNGEQIVCYDENDNIL